MPQTISASDLAARHAAGDAIVLIDVRTPAEFAETRVAFARNHPLDSLDAAALSAQATNAGAPLYFVCRSGGRSMRACQQVASAGGLHVVNVEGGTAACAEAGLPMAQG